MKTLSIDILNTSIGSYALDGIYNELQIVFNGIPADWQGNRIYATFVQDNLNPTTEVIDNAVWVPTEILKTGTDFYVSVYSIAYGTTQVSEPSVPILITVNTTESNELDIQKLAEVIVKLNSQIAALASGKVDKEDGKGLSTNDFTDDNKADLAEVVEHAISLEENKAGISALEAHTSNTDNPHSVTKAQVGLENADNTSDIDKPISNAMQEALDKKVNIEDYTSDLDTTIYELGTLKTDIKTNADAIVSLEEELHKAPITEVPSTLETNCEYNFGEVTELSLAFPTVANDGDVIYATFITGENVTTLTIDTTNTCDIEFVPEANTGYEIYGKFNGNIWIVNYSEYTVSEG